MYKSGNNELCLYSKIIGFYNNYFTIENDKVFLY